jgi:glycosyltransferase involved in cell wall biosynthesis
MRVSVVMCTYNGSKFLREQLDSISQQTRLPDELIVCDDCSSDETIQILDSYADDANFPVFIRRNPDRLGTSKNFEQAISFAQGDIIALSDQDDVWRYDKLQLMGRSLCQNPDAGYIFSDAILIDESGKIVDYSLWQRVSFDAKRRALFSRNPMDQLSVLVGKNVVTGATMAFRSSLKPIVLPIRKLWVHDEWIAFASCLHGARGIAIQEPLIRYRQHSAQSIGVPHRGALWLLKRGWEYFSGDLQAYDSYEHELCKWKSLYALLKRTASDASPVLPLLEGKAAHVALRAMLYREPRVVRPLRIFAELTEGGYYSYSAGWKSAIKDLLIPPLG